MVETIENKAHRLTQQMVNLAQMIRDAQSFINDAELQIDLINEELNSLEKYYDLADRLNYLNRSWLKTRGGCSNE